MIGIEFCACKSDVGRSDGGTDMNTGVVKNTYDSQSVIGTDAAISIEGMPVTRNVWTSGVLCGSSA